MSDLTQWTYKRSHSITSGTELTDYQIKIRVYRTEGTSTGDTVYLGSKCLADYGDIRFVASDGETELSYWMETNAGTYADFWVKVPSITTDSSIYIYYGNASATSMSNGDETFVFFDDFSSGTIDTTTKWTNNGITVSLSSGILSCSRTGVSSWGTLQTQNTFARPFTLESRIKRGTNSGATNGAGFGIGIVNGSINQNGCLIYSDSSNTKNTITASGGTTTNSTFTNDINVYRNVSIKWNSGSVIYAIDNTLESKTVTTNVPSVSLPIGLELYNYTYEIDFIAIRSYTTTEPTQSTWSDEQEVTPYPLKITITPTSGTDPLSVTYNLSIDALDDFTLNYGDGNVYTADDVTSFSTTHIYDTPGTYTVWAEGYTEFATHLYYEIPYGINVSAQAITTYYTFNQTYNVIQFHDETLGSPNEWYWTFGDGTHSYEQHPLHTYHSPGTYQVTLYSSNQYQYDWSSSYVSITQFLIPPQAFFVPNEYNIISPSLPYSITFTNLSTPSFGNTYTWLIDGTTYTTEDVTHSFATYGYYDVSLTASNLLGSDTKSYNDHIKLTRKGKTFYEIAGCVDTVEPFGVISFPTEYMAATDTIVHATIFDENIQFVQSEVPDTPGIDEWGHRNLYSTINEWGHRVIGTLTEWGHRILHPASANDHSPLTFFRSQTFREDIHFNDEWQFGTE